MYVINTCMWFICLLTHMSVSESDLVHQRVWGGQSMDASVAPPAVFILDELWPLLVRRVRTQLLHRRHGWSPHLIGQPVTVGNKQLKEEEFEVIKGQDLRRVDHWWSEHNASAICFPGETQFISNEPIGSAPLTCMSGSVQTLLSIFRLRTFDRLLPRARCWPENSFSVSVLNLSQKVC